MRTIKILFLVLFTSISILSWCQPKPSKTYIKKATSLITNSIIYELTLVDTLFRNIDKQHIKFQIFPRYVVSSDARGFKKGDDLLKYLVVSPEFAVLFFDKNLKDPIYYYIDRYWTDENQFKFSKFDSHLFFKAYNANPSKLFNIRGFPGYFYIKNDIVYFNSSNLQRTIELKEYTKSNEGLSDILSAANVTALEKKLITNKQLEDISDSLWIQYVKAKNKADSIKNKTNSKN